MGRRVAECGEEESRSALLWSASGQVGEWRPAPRFWRWIPTSSGICGWHLRVAAPCGQKGGNFGDTRGLGRDFLRNSAVSYYFRHLLLLSCRWRPVYGPPGQTFRASGSGIPRLFGPQRVRDRAVPRMKARQKEGRDLAGHIISSLRYRAHRKPARWRPNQTSGEGKGAAEHFLPPGVMRAFGIDVPSIGQHGGELCRRGLMRCVALRVEMFPASPELRADFWRVHPRRS